MLGVAPFAAFMGYSGEAWMALILGLYVMWKLNSLTTEIDRLEARVSELEDAGEDSVY